MEWPIFTYLIKWKKFYAIRNFFQFLNLVKNKMPHKFVCGAKNFLSTILYIDFVSPV